MFSPMRLGIVGFGRLAENYYVPAIARMQDVATVCAIADPTEPRRALAAKLLPNARVFETQSQMLSDEPPLDGILVASPPGAHLDALKELANRAPIAVFMEKPLVPPGQIGSLHSIRAETQQRIMLNFNRRFWPRYQQIAAIVRERRIGTLQSVELELQVDVTKWLAVTSHRIDKGQGGALYDLGSQLIDLAGVIVGERPTQVRAEASSTRWEADHVTIQLTFAHTSADARCRVAYDSPTRERIIVRGSDGVVRIGDPNMAIHFSENESLADRATDFFTLARHAAFRHTSMSRMTIELALRAFVARWRDRLPMDPGFDDGLFNAAALEAAHRSIQTGQAEPVNPTIAEALA